MSTTDNRSAAAHSVATPPPASSHAVDEAATTLLSGVTPVLSQLAERVDGLQQKQKSLLQTLHNSPLVDEAALEKAETPISQIPAYYEKLETLQADMLQLARKTASMRQRSAHLAQQARAQGPAPFCPSAGVACANPRPRVPATGGRRVREREG